MALTYNVTSHENDGSNFKKLVTVAFDNNYLTGGYTLDLSKVGLNHLKRIKAQPESNFEFEYDYSTEKLKVLQASSGAIATASLTPKHDALSTNNPNLYVMEYLYKGDGFSREAVLAADAAGGFVQLEEQDNVPLIGSVQHIPVAEKTWEITHAAVPAGNQIYFHVIDQHKNIGILKCDMAVATASMTFSDNPQTDDVIVEHDANAAIGGIPVHYDEGGTTGQRFVIVDPAGRSAFVKTVDGRYSRLAHDAAAAANPALTFNDTAANPWQTLEFISPTVSNSQNITDAILSYQAQESVLLHQIYIDEDQFGAAPNKGGMQIIHPSSTPVLRVNFAGKYYGVFHDVLAAANGIAAYFNDGAALGSKIVYNSPTASDTEIDADTAASKNFEGGAISIGTTEVAGGTDLTALNAVEVEMIGY